jgi:hypothetical protein
MMQAPVDQIINVVSMGNCFVPTARTMFMIFVVAATELAGCTPIWILRADIYNMLFDER